MTLGGIHTVLVLGGYGNFGAYLCRALAQEANIRLLIAGRDAARAQQFATELGLPDGRGVHLNAEVTNMSRQLRALGVHLLIHTAGPFQDQDYRVARACIEAGCHYIDLADARSFVVGISQLDALARHAGVFVTSGASSVPALSAAVVDHFLPEFARLDSIRHGIVSAAKTPGIATIRAVLGYCGKPIRRLEQGKMQTVWGWQGLHRRRYPQPLGKRWLGNCDIPDLTLFPQRYPSVREVVFHAGLGVPMTHWGIWILSWLARWRVMENPAAWAKPLQWISEKMEVLGQGDSAMHVELSGIGLNGQPLQRAWHMVASRYHGSHIPCGVAIALTRQLLNGAALPAGAQPCMGMVSLTEIIDALAGLEIRQVLS